MGQEIVYCSRCSSRLLAADFEAGKAFWVDAKPSCLDCVMGRLSELSPDEEARVLKALEERRGPAPTPRAGTPKAGKRKTSTAHIPQVRLERRATPPGPGRIGAALAAVGAFALILAAAAAFSVRPRPPREPAREPSREPSREEVQVPPVPPPPVVARPPAPDLSREEAARKILEKALSAPADERLARLEEAVWECRGTAAFDDARREHARAQKERGDQVAAALVPLDVLVGQAVARERYGEALAALGDARGRISGGDWTSALNQRVLRLRHGAEQVFAALRDGAVAARRRGAEADVKAAADRVAAWGWPDFQSALSRALDAVPPPTPGLSPEARAAREAWEAALARAAARDYAAAVRDPEDAALLKAAGDARAEAVRLLTQWPKGQALAVEVEETPGVRTRLDGVVVKTSPFGVELRREADVVTAEFDDLTPRSIREVLAKVPGRAAALALLTALEDAVAEGDALPPKYRAWAARAAEERARPEVARKEAEASELWRTAEDARQEPERAIEAVAKLRALSVSHAATLFVRRRRAAIAARLEEGKDVGREVVIPAERMGAAGGFARASHPKAASCWSVAADGVESSLEFSFVPRPETEYRCWVYVGACCAETFAFRWQADGHPEPVPAALAINFLKKTHALHGGPKQPARFEWVALPLPRTAAGPVRVRLLSAQQGFSAAWALLSSTRTAPPGDAVLKEWERARPASAAPPRDAGLVALWTLDEGRGTAAADASPHALGGTLRNDPVWTAGRRRGALSFDGVDDFVEIPKSPKLYFAGPFSVAAWVNIAELPSNKFGAYVVSDYRDDGNRASFALRVIPSGSVQFFWQIENEHESHATSSRPLTPGRWTHVVGVYDGAVRRLYLDGLLSGENALPQTRADIGGFTAIGRPGAYDGMYFRGRIDDVRLYARALSAPEIKALATAP